LNAIRVASAGNESIKTNKPVLVEKWIKLIWQLSV
jgi:hypothetical protein